MDTIGQKSSMLLVTDNRTGTGTDTGTQALLDLALRTTQYHHYFFWVQFYITFFCPLFNGFCKKPSVCPWQAFLDYSSKH
jgi:hypothetical protein